MARSRAADAGGAAAPPCVARAVAPLFSRSAAVSGRFDDARSADTGRGSGESTFFSFVNAAAIFLAAAAAVALSRPVHAARWTVHADGSGTSPTIQSAVNSAASGDTVEIGPGLFNERVTITNKTLLVRGSGRDATEVNGYPHGNVFALRGYGNYTEIRGLTINDGHADVYSDPAGGVYGGGVLGDGAVFALVDCRVTRCFANLGGAVYATSLRIIPEGSAGGGAGATIGRAPGRRGRGGAGLHSSASPPQVTPHNVILVRDCEFDNNTGGSQGGGLCFELAYFAVENCTVRDNYAGQGAGGRIFDSVGSVTGCVFHNNEALLDGGALETEQNVYFEQTSVLISRNTFAANRAGRDGSAVNIPRGITIDYDRNIFALNGGDASATIACRAPDGEYHGACNLFWSNGGAPLGGCVPLTGDVTTDPLFCNPGAGDFRLCESSPALSGDCGARGALGIGCSGTGCATLVVPTTWGALKSLYR